MGYWIRRPVDAVDIVDGAVTPPKLDRAYAELAAVRNVLQGALEIDGTLDHDGAAVGFYGAAPVARPPAYTNPGGVTTSRVQNFGTLAANGTNVAPFGLPTAAEVNNLVNSVNESKRLIQQLIVDLRALGLIA